MSTSSEELSSVNLIVNSIPFSWRERHLRKHFAPFGTIKNYRVMRYAMLGQIRSKGYGFVQFATHEQALAAIEGLNGRNFLGREIRVEFARSDKKKTPTRSPSRSMPKSERWSPFCERVTNIGASWEQRCDNRQFEIELDQHLGYEWSYNEIYDWEPRCHDEGMYSRSCSLSPPPSSYGRLHTVVLTGLPPQYNDRCVANMCADLLNFAPEMNIIRVLDAEGCESDIVWIEVQEREVADDLIHVLNGRQTSGYGRLRCRALDF